MSVKLRLAEQVVERLGEDAEINGLKIRGVFSLMTKSDFGEYLSNSQASFHILSKDEISAKSRLKYRGREYEVVRVVEEQEGIKRLDLRCVREKRSETILPRS